MPHDEKKEARTRRIEELKRHLLISGCTLAVALAPACAYADDTTSTAQSILNSVKNMLTGGIQFLGAAMVVWGGVSIGINVHNGASGNASAIASGVATLIGGIIISVVGGYFGSISTDWLNG